MPTQNASTTVARTEIVVAGRKYDRASALETAKGLIAKGAPLPKDLAVFLRETPIDKKALALVRSERKQFLANSGFTLITQAQSNGFKVTRASAPKQNAAGTSESFSVTLTKKGEDGKVNTQEIKSRLTAMSKSERDTVLAELARLQAEMLQAPDTNEEATEVEIVPENEGVQSATEAR